MPPPPTPGILIRPFESSDVAAANAITNYYIQHTPLHFAYQHGTDAEFRATWESGCNAYPWLAAELDGRVVGYAKAGVWRARDAYARTAETGLYVDHTVHRRGIGIALYRDLIARCRRSGLHTLVAGITLPNKASVKVHEAAGFAYVGSFREVGRKFDQWHDVGFWQLML